jgi:hypothetical protein
MRTQLDDGHDIEGNTLYRLDFDAIIAPGDNTSASAIITVAVEEDDRPDVNLKNYASLYADWQKQMQNELDNAIIAQTLELF